MNLEQVINQINNLSYLKDNNIEVAKIRFLGNKNGSNRQIFVYFKKQKYPCGVYISRQFSTYTQSEPLFVTGVDIKDKDGWTENVRIELCHWLFCRFWIWLKCVDRMYDQFVLGHWPKNSYCNITWELPIFTGLIHDGWCIQKYCLKHLLEMPPLKDMYDWYNDDVTNNLYKNFGYINYYDNNYKELTTEEEFNQIRVGF